MNEWATFFEAIAGAAATLTGLIFVGVSISLASILAIPKLPSRALSALIILLNILIIAVLCLVPNQTDFFTGIEILCAGIVTWVITLKLDLGILNKTNAPYRTMAKRNILFTQLAVLPYIIAGISLLTMGFTGIYWLVPGIVFSFIKAVTDAWVLLIEIHR